MLLEGENTARSEKDMGYTEGGKMVDFGRKRMTSWVGMSLSHIQRERHRCLPSRDAIRQGC